MRRLSYLLSNKTKPKVIIKFLNFVLNSYFEKTKRKKYVSEYRDFLKSKNLTRDWFSHNTFYWKKILKNFENKEFNYLEIGSFEGNSAIFILNEYSKAKIFCVDPWIQSTICDDTTPVENIESNFDKNLKNYKNRYEKIKMKSHDFFLKNKNKFDVIYVDGLHHADNAFEDCFESWKILNNEGVLIIDDYFSIGYQNSFDNPIYGINKFLNSLKNEYQILMVSKYQVYLKKIN